MEHWAGIAFAFAFGFLAAAFFEKVEQGMDYYYRNGYPTKNMAQMDEEELISTAFAEGASKGGEEDTTDPIVVYMDEEDIEAPFGRVKTAPFLELLWRRTGADCDGEEEEMEFPNGKTYTVVLHDTRKN